MNRVSSSHDAATWVAVAFFVGVLAAVVGVSLWAMALEGDPAAILTLWGHANDAPWGWSVGFSPLAHLNLSHAALNAMAWSLLAAIAFQTQTHVVCARMTCVAWPLTQLGLTAWEAPLVVVGLSGVNHALASILVFALLQKYPCWTWAGAVLIGAKMAVEAAWTSPLAPGGGALSGHTAVQAAHLSGTLAGVSVASWTWLRSHMRRNKSQPPP